MIKHALNKKEDCSRLMSDHEVMDVRKCCQSAETQLDSLSQKLNRPGVLDRHTQHSLFLQAKIALMEIRKIQFRYFPVNTLSLLRYIDCKFDENNKLIRPVQKSNWRKYKKEQRKKNNSKLDEY